MQGGHLNVVVSPDILNEPDPNGNSLDESVTNEGGQIQLVCIATGVPQPTVTYLYVAKHFKLLHRVDFYVLVLY